MKMYKILLVLSINITIAQNISTLNVGHVKEKNYHHTFDFENIKDKIIIDVLINNKIRKFILDTGAPTSISKKIATELNYKVIDSLLMGDANSKTGYLNVVQIPQFSINGLSFFNTYAIEKPEIKFLECFGVEGIIGSNSLRNSVVDFDFKNKKITISSDFKNFNYKGLKGHKLFFKDQQSTPILEIKMKLGYVNYNEELIFDTGDDSFYSIATSNLTQIKKFVDQKKIPKELQNKNLTDLLGIIASSNGSFSFSFFGNDDENAYYKFKIQNFVFGNSLFNNLIATTTYGSNSRIGAEILNHGKLTLDYIKKKYYFKPYENTKEIDVNHKYFGFYPTVINNKFLVGIVWDEKIKNVLKTGDEILKINTIDFSSLSVCEIMKKSFKDFEDDDKLTVTIKQAATNEIKVVEIQN